MTSTGGYDPIETAQVIDSPRAQTDEAGPALRTAQRASWGAALAFFVFGYLRITTPGEDTLRMLFMSADRAVAIGVTGVMALVIVTAVVLGARLADRVGHRRALVVSSVALTVSVAAAGVVPWTSSVHSSTIRVLQLVPEVATFIFSVVTAIAALILALRVCGDDVVRRRATALRTATALPLASAAGFGMLVVTGKLTVLGTQTYAMPHEDVRQVTWRLASVVGVLLALALVRLYSRLESPDTPSSMASRSLATASLRSRSGVIVILMVVGAWLVSGVTFSAVASVATAMEQLLVGSSADVFNDVDGGLDWYFLFAAVASIVGAVVVLVVGRPLLSRGHRRAVVVFGSSLALLISVWTVTSPWLPTNAVWVQVQVSSVLFGVLVLGLLPAAIALAAEHLPRDDAGLVLGCASALAVVVNSSFEAGLAPGYRPTVLGALLLVAAAVMARQVDTEADQRQASEVRR